MLRCAAIAVATLIAAACSGPPVGSSAGSTSAPPAEPAAVAPVVVEGGELTVASYNVNFGLAGDGPTIEAIRALGADVVFLQETHRGWERPLRDALADDYPHIEFRHHRTRPGGLAVLSKLAFDAGDVIAETAGSFPAWRVELDSEIGRVQVLNVHLYPPVSAARARLRNGQLEALAELLAPLPDPLVVLGDFNVSPYSPYLAAWLARTGLRDARRGFGLDFTWPAHFPPLGVPIDHILVSASLGVAEHRRLPAFGSDHYPVLARLVQDHAT